MSSLLKKLSDDYKLDYEKRQASKEMLKLLSEHKKQDVFNSYVTNWHLKTQKRNTDQIHYSYLAPIIRYNQSMGVTTKGISMPSELWIWEQNLAKDFKISGAKFDFLGAESSTDKSIVSNFYRTSERLNKLKNSNFKTSCYFGDIIDLVSGRRENLDFVYADFVGFWANPIIDFVLACFQNKKLIKKNGCFFMTVFLLRGSKHTDIRDQTIDIGKNAHKQYPNMNNFTVFDSNYLCREKKLDSGLMSENIPHLAKGIATFIWRQAQKNEISLTVHNPTIYYNEYMNESGVLKRNPMCSLCFTKTN